MATRTGTSAARDQPARSVRRRRRARRIDQTLRRCDWRRGDGRGSRASPPRGDRRRVSENEDETRTGESDFSVVAADDVIDKTATALESNGIRALLAQSGAEARDLVIQLL